MAIGFMETDGGMGVVAKCDVCKKVVKDGECNVFENEDLSYQIACKGSRGVASSCSSTVDPRSMMRFWELGRFIHILALNTGTDFGDEAETHEMLSGL